MMNSSLSTLRRTLTLTGAVLLGSLAQCTHSTSFESVTMANETGRQAGVLLRSDSGASYLPNVIVPKVDCPDTTVAEFALMLQNQVLGNMQWADRGSRVQVTCSGAVKARRFKLISQDPLTALELLTYFALASHTVVVVEGMSIRIEPA